MKRHFLAALLIATLLMGQAFVNRGAALAQVAYPYENFYVIGLCSTVDYDAVAAKALNMAPADLRVALVSGQFLEDIAQSQNVPLNSVKTALVQAHLAEIDQAVNDGLIQADQAQQLKNTVSNTNEQTSPNPPYLYRNVPIYYGIMPDLYSYNFQTVKVVKAAAQSLDKKCPDLVKELENNRSLVALVTAQGGQIGAVIDAMIKAYQTALDQDVKEQLITAAQAKGLRVQLAERVTSLINQSGQPVLTQMYGLPGFGASSTLPMLPQSSTGAVQPGAQGRGTGPVPLPPVSAQSGGGQSSGASQMATPMSSTPPATPAQ